jgi:hypothetical protein
MLREMAKQLGPTVGLDDAIQYLIQDMEEEQGWSVRIPPADQVPPHIRAAMVVLASLATGYAKAVPQV